jgi:hypothetical protein
MLRSLIVSLLFGTTLAASAADAVADPAVAQRVREEVQQLLTRLATSGALGAHPEQLNLSIDEPAHRTADLGVLVDATNAAHARDGLRVLGTSPGGAAAQLGVRAGDVLVAVNGHSLRDLGADESGHALAAATLKASVESLPDGADIKLDVQRGGASLALAGAMQSVTLPALRLGLGGPTVASADMPASGASASSGCGRVSMIDLAPRQQALYGALILTVDGVTPGPSTAQKFRVSAGSHVLEVAERIPTSEMGVGSIATLRNSKLKKLSVDVAPNTTVMIAARFNRDRGFKLGEDTYWDPVAWKTVSENCP